MIEDAAQAHGAEWNGRKAGSLADAGCFSFYPGKNLGGIGEGGAVTTDDANLARKLRVLRDHGQLEKNRHDLIGWNCRMDGIQAAVLSVKLRHLDDGNHGRAAHALRYRRALPEPRAPRSADANAPARRTLGTSMPSASSGGGSCLPTFGDLGIGFGVHYPVPVHLQPAYHHLGFGKGDFPVSERCARRVRLAPDRP